MIKETGKYQRTYEDWVAHNVANKTWAHTKNFWQMEHLKIRHSNPTASQYQFGGNTAQNQSENKRNMANVLEDCANQFMNGQQEATPQQQQF